MDPQQQLSLEQQFELKVFEEQVRQLSLQDAQVLLLHLRESMMHQKMAFSEMLKDAWGIGKGIDAASDLLADG
jgi:hypothetical protein